MSFLRKLAAFCTDASLSLTLSLLALTATLTLTILNVNYIKTTLQSSGFYNNIVASTLKLVSNEVQKNKDPNKVDPKDDIDFGLVVKELTPTVQKVLTPEFLQTNTEKVLNGFGGWLNGTTILPEFTLDFSQIKPDLAIQISSFLKERVSRLPTCGASANIRDLDPFNATCKPPVEPSQAEYTRVTEEFINEMPILSDGVISFATIDKNGDFKNNEAAQKVAKYYPLALKLPFIFGGFGLLLIGLRLAISNNRLRALKGLGHTFVWSGGVLLFTGVLMILLLKTEANNFIGKASEDQLEFVKVIAIPITERLISSFGKVAIYFGTGYAVIGSLFYVIEHHFTHRQDARNKLKPKDEIKDIANSKKEETKPTSNKMSIEPNDINEDAAEKDQKQQPSQETEEPDITELKGTEPAENPKESKISETKENSKT